MAGKKTTNLNMNKWDEKDSLKPFRVELNDNLDKLDSTIGTLSTGIAGKVEKTYVDGQVGTLTAQLADIKTLTISSLGLNDSASINNINKTAFSNVILNFENKPLTLNANLNLTLTNCEVINLNLKAKGYNTLSINGINYTLRDNILDGIEANRDYVNKQDAGTNLFMALNLSGNNVKVFHNTIRNYISRQAILLKNSDGFEIRNNKITDCYSYNRLKAGGTFDNYGDGIHVTFSKNGIVKDNVVENSILNPIGRCGIVVEFECLNVQVLNNVVKGYDRGIHIELTKDFINVENNTITACVVPLVSWSVGLSHVVFRGNYCSDEGLDKNNVLHNSILEAVYKGIVSVLGAYNSTTKEASNVSFTDNEFVVSSGSKYITFLYVENSFHVKFRRNRFINKNSANPTLQFGTSTEASNIGYADFEDNLIEGTLFLLHQDFLNIRNNDIKRLQLHTKTSSTLNSLTDRVFSKNIVRSTIAAGGGVFIVAYRKITLKDNTFYNVQADYFIASTNSIVEGNTIIRTLETALAITLIKNSGRYNNGAGLLYGVINNFFLDEYANSYFYMTPNGIVLT